MPASVAAGGRGPGGGNGEESGDLPGEISELSQVGADGG